MGSATATQPTNTDPAAGRRRAWLLVAMVVAALLLRVPLLGRSIWFDEACMSDQRIGTWPQLLATLYVDIHPPLFVTFMHVWNGIFGDGELSLRMPALLAGLACIPLTWWTGRRLVGDAAALWAALLLTLSPVHVWYCAEARLYTPMIACTLLAFGTFDRLLAADGPRRRGLLALHLANVAVMLALHYYLAVVVVGLALLAPVVARGFSPAARRIVLWHGIGIVLLAGFVFAKTAVGEFETGQGYLRDLDLGELYRFLFAWCWTGNTLTPRGVDPGPVVASLAAVQQGLGVVLAVAGVAQLLRQRRTHPRGWLVVAGLLLLPSFLLGCALVGFGNTYLERTLIPALPFLMLLVGAGLTGLPRLPLRVAGGLVIAFAIASLAMLYVRRDTDWTVYKPNPDWRAAAAYLGREIEAGATGRPVYTSMPNPRPLSYYDVRIQDAKSLAPATSPERIGRAVGKRLGATLGDYAERTFRAFDSDNAALLAEAALIVRPSRPDPADLELPPTRPDDVCYLVRNHWHPHVSIDGSVEALLANDRIELLEEQRFAGISVYKIRLAP